MWYFTSDHLASAQELRRWAAGLPGRVRPPAGRQPGVLRNFRLQFPAYCEAWSGGVADVTADPGKSVAGALVLVPDATMPYLDALYERRAHWGGRELGRYRRLSVRVLPFGVEPAVEAVTYQLTAPDGGHVPPSRRYLELLREAACDLRHSQMWVAHLRSFAAAEVGEGVRVGAGALREM